MGKASRKKRQTASVAPAHRPVAAGTPISLLVASFDLVGLSKNASSVAPRSLFGTPIGADQNSRWDAEVVGVARRIPLPETLEALTGELLEEAISHAPVVEASGRWLPGTSDPETFVPGDIVSIRDIVVGADLRLAGQLRRKGAPIGMWGPQVLADALLSRAQAYFVPPVAVSAVLGAVAPEDGLLNRVVLPAPAVAVFFGTEIPLGDALEAIPTELDEQLSNFERRHLGTSMYGDASLERIVNERDGRITGVVLLSDKAGRLSDAVMWVVSGGPNEELEPPLCFDRIRGFLRGFISSSSLGDIARVAAATVAWGGWSPPPEALAFERLDERARRRLIRTSSFRRRERAGALAGVRVLDVRQTVPSRSGSEPLGGTHTSPIPHYRRPHTKRVRVGPRDAWHYERREIGGTRVLPHGPVRSGEVVWRIPAPRVSVVPGQETAEQPIRSRSDVVPKEDGS